MEQAKKNRKHHGPQGGHGHGMPVEKPKDFKGTFRKLLRELKPHRWPIIASIIMAIGSTVFGIIGPLQLSKAINILSDGLKAMAEGVAGAAIDYTAIGRELLVLLGLFVVSSLLQMFQLRVMVRVTQHAVRDMRAAISQKLSRLPLKFFDSRTHGEILSRVTNDVDTISNTLQQGISQLITSIITIVGVLIMMLLMSWRMTLVTLGTLPIAFVITMVIAKRSQKHFKDRQRHLGEVNGHVEEMYAGHKIIQAYGQEDLSIAQFHAKNDELTESNRKSEFLSGIIMPLLMFVNNIGYVLVCVAGGLLAARGVITIGAIQAFIIYARQFSQPINQTANMANILQSTLAAAERVFEILEEEEELPDTVPAHHLEQPAGAVAFNHVDFRYKDETPLIDDMNLDIQSGHIIAIVGPTGAGKTTLVNLLMRFYELKGGQITLDGVNIRDLPRGELRSLFGMVLQDTWLFHGTIRENIAYGRDDATEEEIVAAAKAARVDNFIRTLPQGYDTVLSEDADNISQGQRQLLTIARAILRDPVIMILDEATSSVDTRTEVLIQHAMQELMKTRTSFVIAHRLSTIRNADLILVMNNGSVIEQGTHESLMQQQGFYYELYNAQFTQPEQVG